MIYIAGQLTCFHVISRKFTVHIISNKFMYETIMPNLQLKSSEYPSEKSFFGFFFSLKEFFVKKKTI